MVKVNNLDHELYMMHAIEQAQKALSYNEVPIGAVVVHTDGTILGAGYNVMEQSQCQTGHAELIAIQHACKKNNDWRLNDCWLYVTLEPCLMCFGLIQLSRIEGIVFGATSPLFGFGYENNKTLPLLKKDLVIKGGIKQAECTKLLQQFFQKVREKKEMK